MLNSLLINFGSKLTIKDIVANSNVHRVSNICTQKPTQAFLLWEDIFMTTRYLTGIFLPSFPIVIEVSMYWSLAITAKAMGSEVWNLMANTTMQYTQLPNKCAMKLL